jgi:exodeoxyribonuclease VII small subunit
MAKKTTVSAQSASDAETYQVLREQLDAAMLKLQDPECDVDQAVALYEQALAVISKLETHLQTAENRITKIQADFGIKPVED